MNLKKVCAEFAHLTDQRTEDAEQELATILEALLFDQTSGLTLSGTYNRLGIVAGPAYNIHAAFALAAHAGSHLLANQLVEPLHAAAKEQGMRTHQLLIDIVRKHLASL